MFPFEKDDLGSQYHWFTIMLILSWEQFDKALTHLEFPLPARINMLRRVAKAFINKIDQQMTQDKMPYITRELLHKKLIEAYNLLKQEIELSESSLLTHWAENVEVSDQVSYSLYLIKYSIRQKIKQEERFPFLTTEHEKLFTEKFKAHIEILKNYGVYYEYVENELLEDDFGRRLHKLYRSLILSETIEYGDEIITPIDTIQVWASNLHMQLFMEEIHKLLSDKELIALNESLKQSPRWEKRPESEARYYYDPIDIIDIISMW